MEIFAPRTWAFIKKGSQFQLCCIDSLSFLSIIYRIVIPEPYISTHLSNLIPLTPLPITTMEPNHNIRFANVTEKTVLEEVFLTCMDRYYVWSGWMECILVDWALIVNGITCDVFSAASWSVTFISVDCISWSFRISEKK